MATLTYSGATHTLELIDKAGKKVGSWTAYNNIDSKFAKDHYNGLTHLSDGTYTILDKSVPYQHKADADGPYGMHGIIRFNYPGHSGVGVHSGRAHAKHKPGPQHATHGCIRTTDDAMLAIKSAMANDSLATITVSSSNLPTAQFGMQTVHFSLPSFFDFKSL